MKIKNILKYRLERKKKAQAWGFDLLIAAIIFAVVIFLFYRFAVNYSQSGLVIKDMVSDIQIATSNLISEGYPKSWNIGDVVIPGILSDDKIDETKLDQFESIASSNYQRSKDLLNTKYDYYFYLWNSSVIDLGIVEGIGKAGVDSSNIENIDAENIETLKSVSKKLPLSGFPDRSFTAVGSRSHMNPETQEYFNDLEKKHGNINTITAGSSLKFCMVAEGRADIYPRLGPTMEWDTAAGQIIAEEAGAEVLAVDNLKPLRYNKESLKNPWFVAKVQLK